jgi:ABC-type multidrug transport system permease subunit
MPFLLYNGSSELGDTIMYFYTIDMLYTFFFSLALFVSLFVYEDNFACSENVLPSMTPPSFVLSVIAFS